MIVVYPIGVPLIILFVLMWNKDLIKHSKLLSRIQNAAQHNICMSLRYTLTTWLGFTISNYCPKYWYFEIIEIYFRLGLTSFAVLIEDLGTRIVALIFLSLAQTKLQLTLKPYSAENQNILAAIGKIQILAVSLLNYVNYFAGLSVWNMESNKLEVNKSWYALIQNLILFTSLLQLGWCIIFVYLEIE